MEIIKNISIVFISIFLEALPFILLGSFISSIIERYVKESTFEKIIPKNKILGSIVGVLLGFFLPACDCAVIPVSKRLIKKGVPINVAMSFMLASPIINPVVLLSTYYAFYKTNPNIFYLRIILGIIVALLVGIFMGMLFKDDVIKNNKEEHEHEEYEKGLKNDLLFIIKNTFIDAYSVIKYLLFGALIASVIQILLPRNVISMFNDNNILSIIVLMLFAYLISLCSTSDSFVGKSLMVSFSETSILAYLVLGPMIDIKNTIVLFGNYRKNFVLSLLFFIFFFVFISSVVVVILL